MSITRAALALAVVGLATTLPGALPGAAAEGDAPTVSIPAEILQLDKPTKPTEPADSTSRPDAATGQANKPGLVKNPTLRALVIELEEAVENDEALEAIVAKFLAYGERGHDALVEALTKILKQLLGEYERAFLKQAKLLHEKKALATRKKWTALRREVMARMHENVELDEAEINDIFRLVDQIDALLRVTDAEVLASSKELSSRRRTATRVGVELERLRNRERRRRSRGSGISPESITTVSTPAITTLITQIESRCGTMSRCSDRDMKVCQRNDSSGSGSSGSRGSSGSGGSTRGRSGSGGGGGGSIGTLERQAVSELNKFRMTLGLPALVIDSRLTLASRDHSKDMATLGFFSHRSPIIGKTEPWDRARRFGTTAHAENIAYGQSTAEQVNRGWMNSPGHRRNMVGPYSRVAVGAFQSTRRGLYWTQMFGR